MIDSIGRHFEGNFGRMRQPGFMADFGPAVSPGRGPVGLLVLTTLVVGLSSCGQSRWERIEALTLASTLKRLAPEARELLDREHKSSNDLKIVMDESLADETAAGPPLGAGIPQTAASKQAAMDSMTQDTTPKKLRAGTPEFRARVNDAVDILSEIRARRLALQQTVRQGIFHSPMVAAVQRDAVAMFQDEITQDDNWILYIGNIQARAKQGRQKDFPEYPVLIRELKAFVQQVDELPLSVQLENLKEEFRFKEEEIPPSGTIVGSVNRAEELRVKEEGPRP